MKFHVVKSKSKEKIAKYLKPCPENSRDRGRPIREFKGRGTFCSNFKGSAALFDKKNYSIGWFEIESGVFVGNVVGLNL